jgi:hypothetical protein
METWEPWEPWKPGNHERKTFALVVRYPKVLKKLKV